MIIQWNYAAIYQTEQYFAIGTVLNYSAGIMDIGSAPCVTAGQIWLLGPSTGQIWLPGPSTGQIVCS